MIALETHLATQIRYTVWANKQLLQQVGSIAANDYLNVRGLLEQQLQQHLQAYELLAGERAPLGPPPSPNWYSHYLNIQTDYQTLLRRFELLASFLDDLDLARTFAHTTVFVPWLEAALPKWQYTLHWVNQSVALRSKVEWLLTQLGYPHSEAELADYFLQFEPQLGPD